MTINRETYLVLNNETTTMLPELDRTLRFGRGRGLSQGAEGVKKITQTCVPAEIRNKHLSNTNHELTQTTSSVFH
jgi:hypothetical protein